MQVLSQKGKRAIDHNGAIFVQTVSDYPRVEAINQNVVKGCDGFFVENSEFIYFANDLAKICLAICGFAAELFPKVEKK